jgi:hypothetical protein
MIETDNGNPRDIVKIPPDLYVFGVDITTYCTRPDYVKKVLEVCLVDLNDETRLFSFTPSILVYHLYHTAIYTDDATDEQREEWENIMMEFDGQNDYADHLQVARICKGGGELVYRPQPYTAEEIAKFGVNPIFNAYSELISDARETYTAYRMI